MGLLTSLIKTGLQAAAAIVGGPVGIALAAASQLSPDGRPLSEKIVGAGGGAATSIFGGEGPTEENFVPEPPLGDTLQGEVLAGPATPTGGGVLPRVPFDSNAGVLPDFSNADDLTKLGLVRMNQQLQDSIRRA